MSPTPGVENSRLASTRCPIASVGSIEPLGILYGLTMNAWIRSASPTAIATVTTSSISDLTVDFSAVEVDDDFSEEPRLRNDGRLTGSRFDLEASR